MFSNAIICSAVNLIIVYRLTDTRNWYVPNYTSGLIRSDVCVYDTIVV